MNDIIRSLKEHRLVVNQAYNRDGKEIPMAIYNDDYVRQKTADVSRIIKALEMADLMASYLHLMDLDDLECVKRYRESIMPQQQSCP